VKPVLTVSEMRAVDAEALAVVDQATLVQRAGTAVAVAALELLGGAYGRRVVVVAGKGNNGADGKVAADRLRRRGAVVSVLDAACAPASIGPAGAVDLVVDAAYGTGFRGVYEAPEVPSGVPVVAVDIPSGVDGDTGEAAGRPLRAARTVTFAAYKPGLLQGDGPYLAGQVTVADIGLDASRARIWVVEDDDLALVPARRRDAHKWHSAVAVVAGAAGMAGAAALCARAASRSGAGMVRLGMPGVSPADLPVSEAVGTALAAEDWAPAALAMAERCNAVVVGPGLGRSESTARAVRELVARCPVPVVVDADGLFALGDAQGAAAAVAAGPAGRPVVLTPHDAEFGRLAGRPPGADRIAATRALAERTGAVVLLKGPTTVVADPTGAVRLAVAGSPRLATAGTGDVLAGILGAFCARQVPAFEAAALAAHVHGRAGALGPVEGLVAGDLPELVSAWLSGWRSAAGEGSA